MLDGVLSIAHHPLLWISGFFGLDGPVEVARTSAFCVFSGCFWTSGSAGLDSWTGCARATNAREGVIF